MPSSFTGGGRCGVQLREPRERQREATDREIDALVYDLYGLTADEIKIVEESAGQGRA